MKVLHINCNYVGTPLHRIMVSHFKPWNIQLTIYTPLWDKSQLERFQPKQNEVIRVCFKKWDRLLFFAKQKTILLSIVDEIQNIDHFDLIHAFTLFTDGNVAYQLYKKYRIPYIVTIRDTDLNAFFRLKPYLRPLGVQIMRCAKAVIFLSQAYKDSVIETYLKDKDRKAIRKKSHVIPNGIDDFWLDNLFVSRDIKAIEKKIFGQHLSVLCVGKINKRKNIPTVQRALSILRDWGWEIDFTVIGKNEDRLELCRIQSDRHTTYYPPTQKEQLIDYYRKADIFVLASHTETFGLVYAEAMSQGLPVIYTRHQGFDGHFADGEVGYAVCDNDAVEIADSIKKICKNYRHIATQTLKNVQKFRWDDICKTYYFLYWRSIHD